jgi:ferredoxin/flavodoxin---NADP+ reductase
MTAGLRVAVVGSGPSGAFVAQALGDLVAVDPAQVTVDVYEQLPVPFGLVRYGVAPDHQGTKAVARVFDRILARDRVGFFGHVEVGRDVGLAQLEGLYDAVVIATGAACDRRLGIAFPARICRAWSAPAGSSAGSTAIRTTPGCPWRCPDRSW